MLTFSIRSRTWTATCYQTRCCGVCDARAARRKRRGCGAPSGRGRVARALNLHIKPYTLDYMLTFSIRSCTWTATRCRTRCCASWRSHCPARAMRSRSACCYPYIKTLNPGPHADYSYPQSYLYCDPLPDTLLRFVALALPGASDAVAERLLAAGADQKLRACRVANEVQRQAVRRPVVRELGWQGGAHMAAPAREQEKVDRVPVRQM